MEKTEGQKGGRDRKRKERDRWGMKEEGGTERDRTRDRKGEEAERDRREGDRE